MAAAVEIPAAPKAESVSFQARYASRAIRTNIAEILTKAGGPDASINQLLPIKDSFLTPGESQSRQWNVAIVGAGVSGLFTAMIFNFLKEQYPGLDVKYTIMESNAEERVGGRLYTYKFPNKEGQPKVGDHEYYDVGAMRFPVVKVMKRTFELFETLDMKKNPDPKSNPPSKGALIPYYFTGENTPLLYNGVQLIPKNKEPITARKFKIDGLPKKIENEDCGKLVDDTIQPYLDVYHEEGAEAFWNYLMATADTYSVRQFLTLVDQPYRNKFTYNAIEFLETLNFGNRWYDQAVSELILESLDFDPTADWWCVQGGAQEIAHRMEEKIKQKGIHVRYGTKVKAIGYANVAKTTVHVTSKNSEGENKETYDSVINSAPLGAMQHMELEGLNLNWGTKQAIRSLGYGASCKVGIRFKKMWWQKAPYNIRQGGVAKTDLPIRACVYPSYNLYQDPNTDDDSAADHDPSTWVPGVLLCSYTWSQEAERIGALISRSSPESESELKELLIHDLARLHTNNDDDYLALKSRLENLYLDHYAKNWYDDPHTVGAFAYFGPGQFSNMYQYTTRNDGHHIIIGEAASAHHAWVVGSLESAVRGVYNFLCMASDANDPAATEAMRAYNRNEIPGPFGPLPAEYARFQGVGPSAEQIDFLKNAGVKVKASPIGELARWQYVIEKIRQGQGNRDVLRPEKLSEEDILNIVKPETA